LSSQSFRQCKAIPQSTITRSASQQSWGVGQKNKRNGAVLFVFVKDRKMFIQVGYAWKGRCRILRIRYY